MIASYAELRAVALALGLPEVTDTSRHAAVILVLRGKQDIGSTFWEVVRRYADALRQQDSKLILAGVDPDVQAQIARTGLLHSIAPENVFLATDALGVALLNAQAAAEAWIAAQSDPASYSAGE